MWLSPQGRHPGHRLRDFSRIMQKPCFCILLPARLAGVKAAGARLPHSKFVTTLFLDLVSKIIIGPRKARDHIGRCFRIT